MVRQVRFSASERPKEETQNYANVAISHQPRQTTTVVRSASTSDIPWRCLLPMNVCNYDHHSAMNKGRVLFQISFSALACYFSCIHRSESRQTFSHRCQTERLASCKAYHEDHVHQRLSRRYSGFLTHAIDLYSVESTSDGRKLFRNSFHCLSCGRTVSRRQFINDVFDGCLVCEMIDPDVAFQPCLYIFHP